MSRLATGQVLERKTQRGSVFALRFPANGARQYVTLGTVEEGWDRRRAEEELQNVLADVRRGIWLPARAVVAAVSPALVEDPGFHVFASEWLAAKRAEGLADRTIEDYEWVLSYHLLPFFKGHRLSEISKKEVDRYKTMKAAEGVLSPGSINKTLSRLASILEQAVEYDLIPANPASGRRRRLKAETPRRGFVQPEQLPALLRASEGLLLGRGRPLLATLAGAGLRIGEALALERRHVNLARGTLTVVRSKTDAGRRTIDLTPALREELTLWLDRCPHKAPTDPVFPTAKGGHDCRQNVRRRLLVTAIERANKQLVAEGIEPIEDVSLHGLRRTFATLRCAVGDDPAYTASQLGHTDATFTMRVYTGATKRRDRLTGAERRAYDTACEWALTGTSDPIVVPASVNDTLAEETKAPR